MPLSQPAISTVPSTGRQATGTSASMPAIRIVTTSTSDVRTSMPPIVADMPGTFMEVVVTTMVIESTSAPQEESMWVCTTAGIVANSTAGTTVLLA